MSQCLDENSALELLDGKLASASRARVERHLESCDVCRELVAELAKVDEDDKPGAETERTPFVDHVPEHAGPYRVERAIGAGSAGTVYRAVDERTKQVVALKYVTDPGLRARFAREIETLSRLAHPGIVRYIGHGEAPGGMYLAMEWLEGEDLERCFRRGPLAWQAVRVLGLRLTAALAHAHAFGCVHRDLSPRNVFLPGGLIEQAKLLDFGLVRVNDAMLERTASQAVLGTPFYMAPEQVRDPRSVDARADLFGLGVLLYEAVSGVRPFDGEDLFTVWLRIVDLPAPDLRGLARSVPEPFVLIIESLLAKDPNARPPSAADVHQSLLQLEGLARSGYLAAVAPFAVAGSGPFAMAAAGPVALAGSSPSGDPSRAISAIPPRRGSGVFVAASVGVGVTALVAASVVGIYVRVARRSTANTKAAENAPSSVVADVKPAVTDASAPVASASPTAGASKAGKDARLAPPEHYVCGGSTVETLRGGHYEPEPAFREIGEAVTAGGDCRITLEDCVIGGIHSVAVLGSATLVLRRCRVQGEVKLVGAPTLYLDGTTLPQAPVIVGKGKVVRH